VPKLDLPDRYLTLLLEILRARVPGAEVWAYGSRVNGHAHPGSDLDLVLRNPADLGKPQQSLFDLQEAIDDSDIPILVDILDWARIPASFYAQINKAHVVIQPSDGCVIR